MRVLYLNPVGSIGGAERSLLSMLASLREARPDWNLELVAGDHGLLTEEAQSLGVVSHVLSMPRTLGAVGDSTPNFIGALGQLGRAAGSISRYVARLRRMILTVRPEVVHTNGFKMHLLAAWACPSYIPLVWHLHDFVSSRRVTSHLMRLHSRRCTLALGVSSSVTRDFIRLCPQATTCTLLNGIDLSRFQPSGSALDIDCLSGEAAVPSGTIRIGFPAVFARWKGHDILLRALARLRSCATPWRAYIIGAPIYSTPGSQFTLDELRFLSRRLGLDDYVRWPGYVPRIEEALRAMDVVVHASTRPEPFGLAIAEAMATGCAVVAARSGGAAELFTDEVNALGHTPSDFRELSEQIYRLISEASLRQRLGTAARHHAERAFDQRRLAQQVIPLYERAISRVRGCEYSTYTAETSTAA